MTIEQFCFSMALCTQFVCQLLYFHNHQCEYLHIHTNEANVINNCQLPALFFYTEMYM